MEDQEYNSLEIKFWYSEDGTPHIDQDDIREINESYISMDNTKRLRESLRRSLKISYKSFSEDGFEAIEGKLELKVRKQS